MASLNKVQIIGNLGKDPETRYSATGDPVTNLTVATADSWKDKATGEKKESTDWHRVVLFGKLAEAAGQYLKKGRQVYIEGRLRTRKWQDKDGQDRYTTEITADQMIMLGGNGQRGDEGRQGSDSRPAERPSNEGRAQRRPATDSRQQPQQSAAATQPALAGGGGFDDDVPF